MRVKDIGSLENTFRKCEGLWTYHGYENEPHIVLASEKHSDGFVHVGSVLQFPGLREDITIMALAALQNQGIAPFDVDFIVASSNAARPFTQALGYKLLIPDVWTEKINGKQVWTGRFEIPEGGRVFHGEELITTIDTTQKVHKALLEGNPHPVEFVTIDGKPVVITIVHRPTELPKVYPDFTVISLMEKAIQAWEPGECPICNYKEINSPALPFKANRAAFMEFEMRFAQENR